MNFLHIIFKHFKLERVNHELHYFTRNLKKTSEKIKLQECYIKGEFCCSQA